MCQEVPQELQEQINNMENLQDTETNEDVEDYREEEINIYNTQLESIQEAIDGDFLPDFLELIDYLVDKLGKFNSALDLLFDMQNFQGKTCLLYIIVEFKESSYFNLQGTIDDIMHGYIKDKLESINKLEALDRCLTHYNTYKHVILSRLLD